MGITLSWNVAHKKFLGKREKKKSRNDWIIKPLNCHVAYYLRL